MTRELTLIHEMAWHLRRHGAHAPECGQDPMGLSPLVELPCDCGFEAMLHEAGLLLGAAHPEGKDE